MGGVEKGVHAAKWLQQVSQLAEAACKVDDVEAPAKALIHL
jgi:hypothetical protein